MTEHSEQIDLIEWLGTSVQERRFAEWLSHNGPVWNLFVRFTREAIAAGHRHYSADAILHRIRWHTSVEMRDAGGWRLNNDYTAWLAREFHRRFPEHDGFFRTRASKADGDMERAA